MNFEIYLAIIIAIVGFSLIFNYKNKSDKKKILLSLEKMIFNSVDEFNLLLSGESYLNRKKYLTWYQKYKTIREKVVFKIDNLTLDTNFKNLLNEYFSIVLNYNTIINDYNFKFVNKELKNFKEFFNQKIDYPLEEKQREAICHDEDFNLVIAGAGTGKTTTAVSKALYLIKRYNLNPEELLFLAFTKKSAEEIQERIFRITGQKFIVNTFHSFGLGILGEVEGEKPSLAFENINSGLANFIKSSFLELLKDNKISEKILKYFVVYKDIGQNDNESQTKNSNSLENKIQTKDGKYLVKSYQEKKICDYFYLYGINYQYESNYPYKTADKTHRQYKPDFYLPEYDIFIEHFALNKVNQAPSNFKNYTDGVEWKRKLHIKNKTKLIETYSWEDSDGILLENLKSKLEILGVKFLISDTAVLQNKFITPNEQNIFANLIITFLHLFKSNGYTIDEIKTKAKEDSNLDRSLLFLEIFEKLYKKYENFLNEIGEIDFSDMITKSTTYIQNEKFKHNFKYIIVDEYQDISVGRYKLIKALLTTNDSTKLFCVGDDWQSIYRFTGSDINLIYDFDKYFGYTKTTKLETTFRFPNNIIDVSTKFILKNPNQIVKKLTSSKNCQDKPFKVFYKKTENDYSCLKTILDEIKIKSRGDQKSVFILGRYNRDDVPSYMKSQHKNLEIKFSTVHSSKGLEADYVIINNVINGKYGFPSNITDDQVLSLLLMKSEDINYSEDRRLFYVAMTRTKNSFYIISEARKTSDFIKDIVRLYPVGPNLCPVCEGEIIVKNGSYGNFRACSNFPACMYKPPKDPQFQWNQQNVNRNRTKFNNF